MYPICVVLMQKIGYPIYIRYVYNILAADLFTHFYMSTISPSSDRRRIKHSSLESPHRDESNGGKLTLLRSLDGEIFDETVSGAAS